LSRSFLLVPWLLAAVLLAACGGSDTADTPTPAPGLTATAPATTPEASPAPSVTTTPTTPDALPTSSIPLPTVSPIAGDAEPDGDRILEAVKTFSDTIGSRVAGTENERIAAGVIADWLDQMGYDVKLQEFPIGEEIARSSSLAVDGDNPQTVPTLPFANSGSATAHGQLVYADAGNPQDFPPETRGNIALVRRDGVLYFRDKVANAIAAGATGVVIYNNEQGILYGSLDSAVSVPVVGISMEKGEELADLVKQGPVTVDMSVGGLSDATSYNVIAQPPDAALCETVTGGHYDSVAAGPGASDNATGTATVLEIAAVMAHNGEMGSNCFVLFGGEELGLLGSRYYVSQLTPDQKGAIKAMLNLDMVGVGDKAWWLIGDPNLQQQMLGLTAGLGISDAAPSELIRGLSSDHASFIDAGIPALMFHRWEDPLLHTPQDVSDRVVPQYLEEAARMGIAFLESLNTPG
jgi:aminopeptidase YwaD